MKYFLIALCALLPCLVPAQDTTPNVTATQNSSALLGSAEAQQALATTEAGKYERKSVTFVNMLWVMDKSVRDMPAGNAEAALEKIKEAMTMDRFDYNALPEAATRDFIAKAGAEENLTVDQIARIMDETLVPKILQVVDLNKELRAQNYTSEAERKSFYATKAKEFGYTDVEIAKVMNAAYLYIPFAQNYWSRTSYINWPFVRRYKVKMDLGALWYRISTKGEKPQVKLVFKCMTTLHGTAPGNVILWFGSKTHTVDGKTISAEEYTYQRGLKNVVRNLKVATKDMPDFRISGQVVENGFNSVGFDRGSREGIEVDDKYRLTELEELPDGSIKEQNAGWVSVTSVADAADGTKGYISNASTIAGKPGTGTVLSEYARVPIDMALKLVTFSGVRDTNNYQLFSGSLGVQLDARYNIGHFFNWPQLFAAVGYSYGSTDKIGDNYKAIPNDFTDRTSYASAGFGGFTFYLLQRYNFSRFSLGGEVGWAKPGLTATGEDTSGNFYRRLGGTGGWYYGGNLGIALHPAVTLEVGAVYETAGISGQFFPNIADQSGIRARVGLVYSPKSMLVDPVDFLRGFFGW